MKTREVINIRQTMTLQELYDFMQLHWDRERYNDFIIRKTRSRCFYGLHHASCDRTLCGMYLSA